MIREMVRIRPRLVSVWSGVGMGLKARSVSGAGLRRRLAGQSGSAAARRPGPAALPAFPMAHCSNHALRLAEETG
ncbi:hypothetical protein AcidC75_08730 [Acidisoma sp. C75]